MSNPYENYAAQQFSNSPANGTLFSLFSESGAATGAFIQFITSPAGVILLSVAAIMGFFAIGLAIVHFIRKL